MYVIIVTKMFNGNSDVIFADYGPQWESLRRVAHSAVRKYSNSYKLSDLVNDVVELSVVRLVELFKQLGLLCGRRPGKYRRGHPDRRGDHLGLLQTVDGRSI